MNLISLKQLVRLAQRGFALDAILLKIKRTWQVLLGDKNGVTLRTTTCTSTHLCNYDITLIQAQVSQVACCHGYITKHHHKTSVCWHTTICLPVMKHNASDYSVPSFVVRKLSNEM